MDLQCDSTCVHRHVVCVVEGEMDLASVQGQRRPLTPSEMISRLLRLGGLDVSFGLQRPAA